MCETFRNKEEKSRTSTEDKGVKKMTCDWPFSTLLRGISSAKEDRGAGLTGFLGLEGKIGDSLTLISR